MSSHVAYVPVAKVPNQPGKYYNHEGYVLIWTPKHVFVLEHRYIVEQVLGRQLTTDETVHHINGVRSDNRPSNLLVCTAAYHKALHNRCKRRYGSWHLPGIPDPYKVSMLALKRGLPLNAPNPVLRMMPPWADESGAPNPAIEGLDTVTSEISTGSAPAESLSSVARILRESIWK